MKISSRTPRLSVATRSAWLTTAAMAVSMVAGLVIPGHVRVDPAIGAGWAGPGHRIAEEVSPDLSGRLDQPASEDEASGATTSATYLNWSGYAATAAQPFNEAQTTFVQPSVTCTVPGAWTVFWVGFDGLNNNTVEQAGTAAQCGSGSNPQPVYYAWWEMYPTNGIGEMTQVAVKPGDTIHAAVAYAASDATYALTVADLTDKQEYTKLTTCAPNLTCARASAEWIVERPTVDGVYTPLADWSTMKLASNEASNSTESITTGQGRHRVTTVTNLLQPVSAFNNTAINMGGDTGGTLATVGRLDKTGTAFIDSWRAAQ